MSEAAKVHSVEALLDLKDALTRLGVDALGALGGAQNEVRRTMEGIQGQLKYWLRESDKRREDMARARADLTHRRSLSDGRGTGCVEQEIALRKAQQRLQEAEEKIVVTRRWLQVLPQAIHDFEGPARALSGFLEADLRKSLAILDGRITALQEYMAVTAAAPEPAPAVVKPEPAAPEAGGPT